MTKSWCLFLCTLLVFAFTQDVSAARSFGRGHHSYPKSGGLSGHGSSHSYPPSRGGLSGNSHGYPSSGGGLSGNSNGYPSSGGHGYPASGGTHTHPSSGATHGYPASGGLSGNSNPSYPGKTNNYNTHTSHTTNVYNNYHYSPPQNIRYTPTHGAPINYPVYHGTPPTYVYQYKDSGSKYGTLLAGLALLNLGTLGVAAYAATHNGNSHSNYKPQPGEVCKFGVKKENGDYEETKIDCQLITSFIFQAEKEKSQNGGATNTTSVVTTVTNVTMINSTNGEAAPAPEATNIIYSMLPNGTLVPLNGTSVNGTANATDSASPVASNGLTSSMTVTTTTTNTTITNALDVKGKPIEVTPGMQCYVIRNTPTSNMRKGVPCGLLQTYADKSLQKNSATRNMPIYTILAVVSAVVFVY